MDARPEMVATAVHHRALPVDRRAATALVFMAVAILTACIQLAAAHPAAGAPGTELWRSTWNTSTPALISNVRMTTNAAGTLFEAADYQPAGHTHIVVRRLTAAGVVRWTKRYAPRGRDVSVAAIAAGPSGSVIIVGTSSGGKGADWLIMKYSGTGKVAWLRTVDLTGRTGDEAHDVVVTPLGRVYVTGVGVFRNNNTNALTRAYTGAGTLLWSRVYDGPLHGRDTASAMAQDAAGNVFVAGATAVTTDETDLLLIRYGSGGKRAWVRTNGAAASYSSADSVAVLGETVGVAGGRQTGKFGDALVGEFGRDGSLKWLKTVGISFTDWFLATGIAENGGIVVAGFSGEGLLTSSSAVYQAYDAAGTLTSGGSVSGVAGTDARALDVVVTPAGTYAATGHVGTDAGSRVWVAFRDGLGAAVTHFVSEPSTGAQDRGESVALASDAVYVGGVLDGSLGLVKLSRL